jgi:hypothetical protein
LEVMGPTMFGDDTQGWRDRASRRSNTGEMTAREPPQEHGPKAHRDKYPPLLSSCKIVQFFDIATVLREAELSSCMMLMLLCMWSGNSFQVAQAVAPPDICLSNRTDSMPMR